jgi:hypothetical protein
MAVFLAVLNVVLFDVLSFRGGVDAKAQQVILIFTSMVIGALSVYFVFKTNREVFIVGVLLSILLCAVGWWVLGYIGMGILMFVLAIMGWKSVQKVIIRFNDKAILYPSIFYQKNLPWSQVSNCMVKDNVLTIDLKSNKLMQFTVQEAENSELNEEEFNRFVRACMKEDS